VSSPTSQAQPPAKKAQETNPKLYDSELRFMFAIFTYDIKNKKNKEY
jgi:hypothetical protein